MPELPDILLYQKALQERIVGSVLESIRLSNPFVLRSISPAPEELAGKRVTGVEHLGKRIILALEHDLFLIVHLMIAGRFQWKPRGAKIPGRIGHAAFDFSTGTLLLTEAGTKKRASLHLAEGSAQVARFDAGGIGILECTRGAFADQLKKENHTLKRSLTDPRLFSGVGNAYSDEILHAAKLSPLRQTAHMTEEEIDRLFAAAREILTRWIERLQKDTGNEFPRHVTAFREGMAVHGRFRQPCPVCGTKVQRIVYAQNECNYCARCQTEGKLLADRAFSRLLKADWPTTIDELEARLAGTGSDSGNE